MSSSVVVSMPLSDTTRTRVTHGQPLYQVTAAGPANRTAIDFVHLTPGFHYLLPYHFFITASATPLTTTTTKRRAPPFDGYFVWQEEGPSATVLPLRSVCSLRQGPSRPPDSRQPTSWNCPHLCADYEPHSYHQWDRPQRSYYAALQRGQRACIRYAWRVYPAFELSPCLFGDGRLAHAVQRVRRLCFQSTSILLCPQASSQQKLLRTTKPF